MSAMCCTRGSTLVSSGARSRLPTITVRLSPEEKQRFAELAAGRGLSECALAAATLRALLAPDASSAFSIPSASRRDAATDRITIRLRPGDGASLEARAARRQMKVSTYPNLSRISQRKAGFSDWLAIGSCTCACLWGENGV